MKKGWEVRALSTVASISYGYTHSASSEPVGPRMLRITDLQDDRVDWESVPYCQIASSDLPKYRLASGDIVFARTGATTGKSYLVTEPPKAVFASYLIRLRLLDKTLLPKFVSLYFQTAEYWKAISEGSTGSAQGGFNATKLGALAMPVPPLPEQRRIVGILDRTFDDIATVKANAVRNLAGARAIFDSRLDALLAKMCAKWELVPLADLAEDITDGDHMPPPKAPRGVPFVTIGNIEKVTRTIDFSDTYMVPQTYFRQLKDNKRPRSGDVLYTVTGSYGIPVIVDGTREFCFQRHIALVRPQPDTHTSWLYYLLLSRYVLVQAQERATGTAQKTVSLKALRSFTVPRVPLAQQIKATAALDALAEETRHLATIYQKKLMGLDSLKAALLHDAFSGTL